MDLCITPSRLPESKGKAFRLMLRCAEGAETEYMHIAYVSDETAVDIIKAGAPFWLHGEPDWEKREAEKNKEQARVLREQADALEAS